MGEQKPRILLLIPNTSYRTTAFLSAGSKLGVEVAVASETKRSLADLAPGTTLKIDFRDSGQAVKAILEFAESYPLKAVLGVDDESVILAAEASLALGLVHNPIEAVMLTRNKVLMREKLSKHPLLAPQYWLFSLQDQVAEMAQTVSYPCVLKPLFLSASQGVIRANNPTDFLSAFQIIESLLNDPAIAKRGQQKARQLLVESYIPGAEIALEGLLIKGKLKRLALFDKPDTPEGPFFPETIYTTPSQLSAVVQRQVDELIQQVSEIIGLYEGPIHAEMRVNEQGLWLLEIAARSIGGLCSRVLQFTGGMSLEELILRHVLGRNLHAAERQDRACGVMMLSVSQAGVLKEVRGLEAAKQKPGIKDVLITIAPETPVEPLPKDARYLGFIFAEGETPQEVEANLRQAEQCLEIVIDVPDHL
ncbi:ATP-grasp domain-containing protein [Deltaproteobacteria bacterium TL4]